MATLIPAHGEPRYVAPKSGKAFTLEELQGFVGGYIEAIRTPMMTSDDGAPLYMFLNEDGKRERLPYNGFATSIMRRVLRPDDVIVGDVVLCTRVEAGEPDDDGEET